ncbi:NFAT activation molecule 1 [Pelodiscus sinensis]|uniref:NFAT activation molecule 1 n=1 Tax=Pelodiscus sinensis TaxID=13735 RepID=UPI0003C48130|nr:NFAT activation molecule 1 [Pelodiscus sinensis]|eukprot:XP_006120564.1 NFAT activation molecule 1 [Pelodiscus sinensis]
MASSLNVIFLLLGFLQFRGWQVAGLKVKQQDSLVQVAFPNEEVSMKCLVSYPYMKEYTSFSIRYYRMDSKGKSFIPTSRKVSEQIPPGKENQTVEMTYEQKIGPLKNSAATGTYYCEVMWKSTTKTGNGVFILVRDKGYTEPTYNLWKFLIALTTILAILSITETALLLWKRKVRCPVRSRFQMHPVLNTGAQVPAESSEPSGSVYTCLESHQAEVYSVLENDTKSLSLEKNPTAKVQDMISSQPDTVGSRNENYEKTGKRKKKKEKKSQQETPEVLSDALYENI